MPSEPQPQPSESLVFETDWLASRPFFYNLKAGLASDNVNDVIDLTNVEFDPEGLNDYLDFGFSVFGHTPLRDVRMMRYSSRLYSGPGGLRVEHLDDPALEWLDRESTVDEVLEVASAKVNEAAAGCDADIVVPTSGGLDSRLISTLLSDRSRVRAFTYGISDDPGRSFEVVKARELVQRLRVRWDHIPLGEFHRYLDDWDALFGISVQAHGMYHMEFYRAIRDLVAPGSLVLSGACGEWFAGHDYPLRDMGELRDAGDVFEAFRWGDMWADSRYSRFSSQRRGATQLLDDEPRLRAEKKPRIATVIRLRMALLTYLLRVPASLGLRAQSPFADIDLAMRMLTLPAEQRLERRWEHEFFASQGLDLESEIFLADSRNTLNFQGMRKVPLKPLDVGLLSEVVQPDYVRRVNRYVGTWGLSSEALWRLGWIPGFRRAAKALSRTGFQNRRLDAYGAYLTLKPLETLLQRRERARDGDAP